MSPLGGVSVSLRPETGGASTTVIADKGGFFEFDGVPHGRYRLSLNLPAAVSVAFSNLGKIINETLPPVAIDAFGQTVCRAEIMVGPSASISGTVRFPDGKKAEGWVKADTVTSLGRPWNTVLTSELEPSGSFQLAHLKPGRYLAQFTRKQGFVQGEAQIIELREGERKTGIVLIAN
ncbi:MAG: hypothetical protein JST28_09595 [Acidobacteria bacterium]|nr:hypothetical protein [Acidobacteriota bacterium]